MARRRMTPKQREAVKKASEKQRQDCARGNHHWWPDHQCNFTSRGIEPRNWSTEQRFPMPTWDKKTVICTGCKRKGSIRDIEQSERKRVRDIFKGFVENTLNCRESRESELGNHK